MKIAALATLIPTSVLGGAMVAMFGMGLGVTTVPDLFARLLRDDQADLLIIRLTHEVLVDPYHSV